MEELETLRLIDTFGEFKNKFTVLNTHVSINTKMIRFSNNVFMTKELRK